jgi:hypothetical protein
VWRRSQIADTWTLVPASNTLADVNPENDAAVNPNYPSSAPWHGISGQGALFTAWNGACYDDVLHEMHIGPAGGHGDYGGNERYRIGLGDNTPAWSCIGKPTGAIGNTGTLNDGNDATGVYFDNRPRSTHTYNYLVHARGVGPVIARLAATHNNAACVAKAWKWDRVTGEFTFLVDYSGVSGVGGILTVGAACYDPTRHCIWMLHTGTTKVLKLDLGTNVVTSHGTADNWTNGNNFLVYVQSQDCLLSIGAGGVGYNDNPSGFSHINLSTFAHTTLSWSGSFASGFASALSTSMYVVGIAWDEVRQRFVMWHNSTNRAQLSTLTPNGAFTNAWTAGALTVSGSNTVTPSAPQSNGTYGRFQISPSFDGVFLLNGISEQPYFYAFS